MPQTLEEMVEQQMAPQSKPSASPSPSPTPAKTGGERPNLEQLVEQQMKPAAPKPEDSLLTKAGEYYRGTLAGPVSTLAHGADWVRSLFGAAPEFTDPAKSPRIHEWMTPPPTFAGRIGFGAEQMAEQTGAAELAGLAAPLEGAGLAWAAARMGRQALASGLMSGAQTGTTKGALIGAGLGAAGAGIGEVAGAKAPEAAERALSPLPKKMSLAEREEIAQRAVQRGATVPMTRAEVKANFPSLQPEMTRNKALIDHLTKDPNSVYSQRSISIDDVLTPVDRYIARVRRVDPQAADALAANRAHWAEELGYRPATPGTPAKQVPILNARGQPMLDAQGNPLSRTVPGTPGTPAQTATTVAQVQKLKEDFGQAIPPGARGEGATAAAGTTGRKLAERGLRRGVEEAIPEEPIRAINHVIERDLNLKKAIMDAVKRNPKWMVPTLSYVGGELGVEAAKRLLPQGREHAGALTGAEIVGTAAFLTAMASKNPRAYTRLLIALRRGGADIVPAGGAFMRSVTGPGEAPRPRGPEQYVEPEPSGPSTSTPPSSQAKPPRAAGGQVSQMLAEAGQRYGVPPALLRTVARIESANNPRAVSPKGAVGVMQLMPDVAAQYGVKDLTDPRQSIEGGTRLLRHLMEKYKGNLRLVLAAYNAGEGAVDQHGGRVPPYPETQEYVRRGLELLGR